MNAEEYYRAKNYLIGKELTSQDLENIAIIESYAEQEISERLEQMPDNVYGEKFDLKLDLLIESIKSSISDIEKRAMLRAFLLSNRESYAKQCLSDADRKPREVAEKAWIAGHRSGEGDGVMQDDFDEWYKEYIKK